MKPTSRTKAVAALLAAILLTIGIFSAAAQAASFQKFSGQAYLTSVGQNSDAAVMKVLLNTRLKMGMEYNIAVKADALGDIKTLVLVLGASNKGLGAAGVTIEQEMDRARALIAYAKAKGVRILSLHTGGSARRGESSNALISLCVPASDYVVVVAEGNKDQFFNEQCGRAGVPLAEVATLAEAGTVFKSLFAE